MLYFSEPTSCVFKNTAFQSEGNGDAKYLDRHSLQCPSGYVINYMKLERSVWQAKIRYKYKCCRSQLSCSNTRKTNQKTTNGNGNSVYLDRQTIQCDNNGINYLKLDSDGGFFWPKWNYKYDCCSVSNAKSSVSCYNKNTGFNQDGGGHVGYLERHTLQCNSDREFITYLKLNRNKQQTMIRYDYKCCGIKQ